VEKFDNGDRRLTTTDPAAAQTQVLAGSDGIRTATFADGTITRTVLAPDPRWSVLAPLEANDTVTTPGGKVLTTTAQRTVTLSVRQDVLSLRTQTDTVSINGRVSTSTFDAPSRTSTSTSAGGRPSHVVVDDHGRPVQAQIGDLTPLTYAYDTRGRVVSV